MRVLALGLPAPISPTAALDAVAAAGVGGPALPAPTVGCLAAIYLGALCTGPFILAAR